MVLLGNAEVVSCKVEEVLVVEVVGCEVLVVEVVVDVVSGLRLMV